MQNPNNQWNKNTWMLYLLGWGPSFKVTKNLIQTRNIWIYTKRKKKVGRAWENSWYHILSLELKYCWVTFESIQREKKSGKSMRK
jgi:hypothetical protein